MDAPAIDPHQTARQPEHDAALAAGQGHINVSQMDEAETHPQRETTSARAAPLSVGRPALQLLVGYAFLVAGVDKLLLHSFPSTLTSVLQGVLRSGNIPAPFAAAFRLIVLPHAVFFGYAVEWGETLTGIVLIAAGIAYLVVPPLTRHLSARFARYVVWLRRIIDALVPIAAAAGLVMGLGYYVVDGVPWQGFMPSVAFGGALDEGFLLALGSLALLIGWAISRHAAHRALLPSRSPQRTAQIG
jgi:hypothetical protein